MVQIYLFLVVVLLALHPGRLYAQALPVALPAAPLATSPVVPDTAAALQRLFAHKRRRQGYLVGAVAVVAVGALIGLASSQPVPSAGTPGFGVYSGNDDLNFLAYAAVTLPAIPLAAVAFGGWGHRQQERVLSDWQQQHHLPRWVKRQLKASYFY